MIIDQCAQALIKHMGVDLRCRDIGMPEQLLYGAQIGPALQQMRGKGVAQHMRRDVFRLQPGFFGQRLQFLYQPLPRQMAIYAG